MKKIFFCLLYSSYNTLCRKKITKEMYSEYKKYSYRENIFFLNFIFKKVSIIQREMSYRIDVESI